MKLKDKTAVVTGSSSGIGKAIAVRFAQEGANVVVHSKSNRNSGELVVKDIGNIGRKAVHLQGDLTKPEEITQFFSKIVAKFGTIDILVNNAGRAIARPFFETDLDYWVEQLTVNLLMTVLCSLEGARIMRRQGSGKIINTASIRGLYECGRGGIMAYSAAKAGVLSFTKTLAKELAPEITVNAVAPGIVETSYLETVTNELKERWLETIPMKRFMTPDEVAGAYVYLARTDSLTGSVIVVDGGQGLGRG